MSRFVPVTTKGNNATMWVNLDRVQSIAALNVGSDIVFSCEENDYLFVLETPEEILALGGA